MSIYLSVEYLGKVVLIRFTRPEIRNPLSANVLAQLEETVAGLENLNDNITLVFTGSKGVFASGADLRQIAALKPEDAPQFSIRGQSLFARISRLPHRTIAAVNGYCFGGALDLALSCTHRVASAEATFAHPGAGLGIITGWGGTQRLPRLVGRGIALEMFFTADPIGAERALQMGLIDAIVEDLFNNEYLAIGRPSKQDPSKAIVN